MVSQNRQLPQNPPCVHCKNYCWAFGLTLLLYLWPLQFASEQAIVGANSKGEGGWAASLHSGPAPGALHHAGALVWPQTL